MKIILSLTCLLAFFKENMLNIPEKLLELRSKGYELIITETSKHEITRTDSPVSAKIKKALDSSDIVSEPCINGTTLTHFKNRFPELGLGDISVILKSAEYERTDVDYTCVIDWKNITKQANEIKLSHMTTPSLLLKLRDLEIITNPELLKLSQKLIRYE